MDSVDRRFMCEQRCLSCLTGIRARRKILIMDNNAIRETRVTHRLAVALATLFLLAILGGAATGFPVTVQDDRGREITVREAPDRIVVVGALYGEIVVDLDVADRVVGIADSPNNPQELQDRPSVGPAFAPSVESIVGLEPDVVLGAWADIRTDLERAGVVVLTAGAEGGYIAGVPDIFAAIRTVGVAVGTPTAAKALIGGVAEEIVILEGKVLGRERVKAALLYMDAPDSPPYVGGSGSVEHELLLRAAGWNVFADVVGFPQVSLEEVLARDPEVIFTDPAQVENVMGSDRLQGVSAVREGRVYPIRAAQMTSTRVASALREIAQRLHPEAFQRE